MDAATPTSAGTLQFDTAEPTAQSVAGAKACATCATPIQSVYHMADGEVICTGCRIRMEGGGRVDEGPLARAARATLFGAGMALAGSVVYWAVLAATDTNFALLAILVGFMVGRAVHVGSRERGGWGYQSLAVGLTYLSIVTSFVPLLVTAMRQPPDPTDLPVVVQYVAAFVTSIPLPFLMLTESPITVLIVGIGLWQAWKQTKRTERTITGPYYVNRPQPAPPFGAPALG
ncbi:MAG TPA: hypothetical protein VEX86_01215 [Longimicrobium sp.]|nr:hypothetical protein [Longimicrobium sp.]